ncbi:response regulator transcription factor [candidate division KSB1 bacterium]|nr:response regulator transcription factor [candidate division KSB1 bacterium]
MKINILLVEDHHVIREGFRALLESQPELQVVGETDNGAEAIDLALKLQPHVVIMDIGLRGSEISGIQATRKITAAHKEIKVIALSVLEEGAMIKGMMAAGASGYLSKGCKAGELMAAIHTVLQGKFYFSAGINATIQEEFVHIARNSSPHNPNDLSDRELEVLRLIAQGENTKAIGLALKISPKTVDAHRRNLMDKLKLDNIADLTKYAIREKIIQEGE